MYIPASVVVAVMVLLTGPIPAALVAVTLILYLLSSSSPAIVNVEKPETMVEPSSIPGQPTEVSLCHSTTTPVTTDPLGRLPLMVIVVAVTTGDVSRTGAGNGTRGTEITCLG